MASIGQLVRRAALFEQLGTMLSSGVPLISAMEMASRTRATGISKKTFQELIGHLKDGHTFTDAMQLVSGQKADADHGRQPNRSLALSDFDIALLSAGEESGKLDTCFKTLARSYAARAQIIRNTIKESIVTVVTLHVFLLVFPIPLWQNFALGLLHGEWPLCIPFIIEKIIVFGFLYGVLFLSIFSFQGNRGEGWRSGLEAIFGLVPWLGTALKYLAVSRLSLALGALLNAGVPVIRAWQLASESCGSPRLKQSLARWLPQLETGTTPAEMVSQISYFPEMFDHLYRTGEVSGRSDETLAHLHTYFEEEGFRKLQTFCRVLNYAIYFGIALLVAMFVINFWVGYYKGILNAF